MDKKIIEGVANATRKAYKDLRGQLIAITLAKNQVFHVRSKHIDIRFYYLRDCITNKEIEVKYVKTQN
jgi:hypothetical protein